MGHREPQSMGLLYQNADDTRLSESYTTQPSSTASLTEAIRKRPREMRVVMQMIERRKAKACSLRGENKEIEGGACETMLSKARVKREALKKQESEASG